MEWAGGVAYNQPGVFQPLEDRVGDAYAGSRNDGHTPGLQVLMKLGALADSEERRELVGDQVHTSRRGVCWGCRLQRLEHGDRMVLAVIPCGGGVLELGDGPVDAREQVSVDRQFAGGQPLEKHPVEGHTSFCVGEGAVGCGETTERLVEQASVVVLPQAVDAVAYCRLDAMIKAGQGLRRQRGGRQKDHLLDGVGAGVVGQATPAPVRGTRASRCAPSRNSVGWPSRHSKPSIGRFDASA